MGVFGQIAAEAPRSNEVGSRLGLGRFRGLGPIAIDC
jgi:hypothetical protein